MLLLSTPLLITEFPLTLVLLSLITGYYKLLDIFQNNLPGSGLNL